MPDPSKPTVYRYRILVVGEPTVGKTAIVQMLTSDGTNFPKNYAMTAGIDLSSKIIPIPDTNDSVEFLFLDTSGKDIYTEMIKKSAQQSSICCLVFDVTKKSSFEKISHWNDVVQPMLQKGAPGLLLANKIDLSMRRYVSESSGKDFALKNKLLYQEVSARDNFNVKEAFLQLAMELYRRKKT